MACVRHSGVPLLFLLAVGLAFGQDTDGLSARAKTKTIRELAKQDSSAIPKLQPYLRDSDREVRLEAVRAIVTLGTQHSLDPLLQATRDNDPEIQTWAVDGIVNFYVPGYLQTGLSGSFRRISTGIKGRFTDTNDEMVDPTIRVRPEIPPALGRIASGGVNMEARAHAARALGILRGQAAVSDLIAALRSKDDAVMYESLVALQKIRDPKVAPQIAYLFRDPQERVQLAAIETAGLLGNREVLPMLRDALQRTDNRNVQRMALSALAMMPDPANRSLYASYFTVKDDSLRAASAEGYARLKSKEDLPALTKAYTEERKTGPRLALAFALVSNGRTELAANSPLQELLNGLDTKGYRGVVQPYLTELLRDEQVRRTVYPTATSGTRNQKIALAQALAQSGGQDAQPVLETISRDSDNTVGQEGLRALRILKARLP